MVGNEFSSPTRSSKVVLSNVDRHLLQRCLSHEQSAWQEFVDRFLGLGVHVVDHTLQCRDQKIAPDLREDLISEIFLNLLRDDMLVLRNFKGNSSLATYLTVVARRVVVRKIHLLKLDDPARRADAELANVPTPSSTDDLGNAEEVAKALGHLASNEATAIRLFHMEGKSYSEIANATGMPENSIGPLLSRARQKIRESMKP